MTDKKPMTRTELPDGSIKLVAGDLTIRVSGNRGTGAPSVDDLRVVVARSDNAGTMVGADYTPQAGFIGERLEKVHGTFKGQPVVFNSVEELRKLRPQDTELYKLRKEAFRDGVLSDQEIESMGQATYKALIPDKPPRQR